MTISDSVQDLMRLLSQVIFADGHIFQSEIEAFISASQRLGLTDVDGQILSPLQIQN